MTTEERALVAKALAGQREYLAGLMLSQCVAVGSGPELERNNGVWQEAAELLRSGAGENALLERFT